MINWAIYGMVYLGSALMVYNVYSYIMYARHVQRKGNWDEERTLLKVPIVLLVLFLLGYMAVGIFGKPDLIVSGILFGGSIFVFVIFRLLQRITRRIHANEQLESMLVASEESSRMKSDFLSTMSHEMRTPMNAIIGIGDIALKNPALPPQSREQLVKIGDNARRLLSMIDDALDMSHFESGGAALKAQLFSMPRLLDSIAESARAQCDAAGLRFDFTVGDGLGGCYMGDERLLRRALVIILENAVKFTPRGGAVAFAAQRLEDEGSLHALRFTVTDTGAGIDDAFLPRLFQPFSREDSSSTSRYGGSGLGLAIARRIALMMGGDITVESRKSRGSAFTVAVRLEPTDDAPAEPIPVATAPEDVMLGGRRVLIAEDIDMNAEILADLLDMEEISSDRAENGQAAVERFSQSAVGHYDAILMDLRMPVMDGLDAARAIRALERGDARFVPIVALTANAFDADRMRALDAGMDDYLSKPVDVDMLVETLKRLIARREAEER